MLTHSLQLLNWDNYCRTFLSKEIIDDFLISLEDQIIYRSYLIDDVFSDADKHVFFSLSNNKRFMSMLSDNKISEHLTRYYRHIETLVDIQSLVKRKVEKKNNVKDNSKNVAKEAKSESNSKFEDGGKFIGLKGGEKGKVVVRFPPEASGFLHIGHAKAAMINQHYKDHYEGELIMRFDDTNPAKESSEFEHAILCDVNKLGVAYDRLTYTSDHFDLLIDYCEKMLLAGNAYVDDTEPEVMKKERELCQASKCRSNSVEDNVDRWREMVAGSDIGKRCCVRVKMDMASKNGCMRDPTIYRCKTESHVRTGDKYKVYPTYDFACPIVDSIEGVTHSLRTSEYNDRNEQFYTILDMVNLRKPNIADYSRLSLQNTVLSKRKLTWIVSEGYVDGWDDPRMPTVRGILRHGMTVEGLKEFVIAQGFGRANVVMEWDKIWAFNKKVIDPVAPRFTGLSAAANDLVIVRVSGQSEIRRDDVARHPKNASVGTKAIWYTPQVLVERADVNDFEKGTNVTFVNWGNLKIDNLIKDDSGMITSVDASLNLDDHDFKKTLKVTWLPVGEEIDSLTIPMSVVTYGDLITKSVLDKDDDFKDFVNKDSKKEECLLGDMELKTLKRGDIIQLQRKGYFICDEEYKEQSTSNGKEYPLVLINIPEGNKKERPTAGLKQKSAVNKEVEKNVSQTNEKPKSEPVKDIVKTKVERNENMKKKEEKGKCVKKQEDTATKTAKGEPTGTKLGLDKVKETEFSDWYAQVITKSELLDYYDISGCYILLPTSYDIWERIQSFLDKKIKLKGVKNCYFPMFISESCLMKEKEHISDFSPEVAWVTMCGDKKMERPVAIRPTSETAMYPYFSKFIKSHRDLPLKLNQWCNVVRWEFKDPMPFLRTREFLWQEGHTAYASQEDATREVHEILDLYALVYEHLLAIPVVKGRKTEKEKFAGGDFTTTTEIYIPGSGRAIQGATSHHLGQNFSKMFEVTYESTSGKQEYVYQNSWGMTTRTIGIVVMVHGDNKGLVLPPRVADTQVIVVPCGVTAQTSEAQKTTLTDKCKQVMDRLLSVGCRAQVDLDEHRSPGWKFNHWEMKGVPIRVEIGPRDLQACQVVLCHRHNGLKETTGEHDLETVVLDRLDKIQAAMFAKAKCELDEHRVVAYSMADLCGALDKKMLITAPFCGDKKCEDEIKVCSARNAVVVVGAPSMGAKSLCIPFEQPDHLGTKCVNDGCSRAPKYFTMFGRSY